MFASRSICNAPRNLDGELREDTLFLEVISGRKTAAEVCRENQLKSTMFANWKKRFLASAPQVCEREHAEDPAEARIAELEQLVGKLTLKLAWQKKPSGSWKSTRMETCCEHRTCGRRPAGGPGVPDVESGT